MQVKLLSNLNRNGNVIEAGKVVDIPEELAKELLNAGAVEVLDVDNQQPVAPAVDTPVAPTPEGLQQDFQQTGAVTPPSDPSVQ